MNNGEEPYISMSTKSSDIEPRITRRNNSLYVEKVIPGEHYYKFDLLRGMKSLWHSFTNNFYYTKEKTKDVVIDFKKLI